MPREAARALLVDMDGTLRRWDPAHSSQIEESAGLPPGALLRTAMSWDLLRPAIAGEVSHAQWMAEVAKRLSVPLDVVTRWQEYRGEVDQDVLAFVREVRAAGRKVGLATNATDLLADDLVRFGLTEEFDAVVNSSEVGIHKPAPEYWTAACVALRVEPRYVLLLDDDDRAISGARAAKLAAFRWTGSEGLPYVRKALGLPA